jgi:peptidoglycan-associated lipoprotein
VIKSSAASKPVTKPSAASTGTPKPVSKNQRLLFFTLRLLLLVLGGGLAFAVGVGIAQFYPARNPQAPIWQNVFRRPENFAANTRQLPPPPIATPTPPPNLTPEQSKQLRSELQQLETQLNELIGRTATLETKLGSSRPTETLESRLQVLSRQLGTPEVAPAANVSGAAATPQASEATTGAADAVSARNGPMVTLPSDVLFAEGSAMLRPQTGVILDNLVADLKNYQGASVRIAGHTDDAGDAQENQALSFRRAQAVLAYLAGTLGNQYHWVVMGYGETRPVAENNTDLNRQRNRRIEIVIEPKASR